MIDPAAREAALTFNRIRELQLSPVLGEFDAAHLKEIHRRIFQDLPQHRPGQFRVVSSQHLKTRDLEGESSRYVVGYAGGDFRPALELTLQRLQGGQALQQLSKSDLARTLSQWYGDLDYLHPFSEGNSRTLREFTRELALQAGYDLDWYSTDAGAQTRSALYVARDMEVFKRKYPGLNAAYLQAHAKARDYAHMHHAWHMLQLFQNQGREDLHRIIERHLQPL